MNMPRYKNFILSHFKSLECNKIKTLLCRDPLFISSVEVDCKQFLSSFITTCCAKKGRKKIEVRAMSGEVSSRELSSEGRLIYIICTFPLARRIWGNCSHIEARKTIGKIISVEAILTNSHAYNSRQCPLQNNCLSDSLYSVINCCYC